MDKMDIMDLMYAFGLKKRKTPDEQTSEKPKTKRGGDPWGFVRREEQEQPRPSKPPNISQEVWDTAFEVAKTQGRPYPIAQDIAIAESIVAQDRPKHADGVFGGMIPNEPRPAPAKVAPGVHETIEKPPQVSVSGNRTAPGMVTNDTKPASEPVVAPPVAGGADPALNKEKDAEWGKQITSGMKPSTSGEFFDFKTADPNDIPSEFEESYLDWQVGEDKKKADKWQKWENVAAAIMGIGAIVDKMEQRNAVRQEAAQRTAVAARSAMGNNWETGKKMNLQGGGATGFRLGAVLRKRRGGR